MIRALLAGALLSLLWPASAHAGGRDARHSEDAGHGGGAPQGAGPTTSDEDREVIENLDLLQAMDGAKDLDLLLELNKDADRDRDGE